MKRLIAILPLLFLFIIVGCKDEKKTAEPEVVTVETKAKDVVYAPFETTAEFKDENVAKVYDFYIRLKTAFVNTNPKVAVAAAKRMSAAMDTMEVDSKLVEAVAGIAATEDIAVQRTLFVDVTAAMESMLEGALNAGTIYKQYCPMAFDNTGAYWLSNSNQIRNPYFGDKMLKCGRVASEIK